MRKFIVLPYDRYIAHSNQRVSPTNDRAVQVIDSSVSEPRAVKRKAVSMRVPSPVHSDSLKAYRKVSTPSVSDSRVGPLKRKTVKRRSIPPPPPPPEPIMKKSTNRTKSWIRF